MKKYNINGFIPMPVCIIGTRVNGKDNFMTVAWITHISGVPPLLVVSVNEKRLTSQGIESSGAFSVNVPGSKLVQVTDYVGIVSGKKVNKDGLFDTFRGEEVDVPLIKDAGLCLECRLQQTINILDRKLYVGEILAVWSDEQYMSEGMPDLKKMDVFFFSMPDNRYWSIGEEVGKAFDKENRITLERKEK